MGLTVDGQSAAVSDTPASAEFSPDEMRAQLAAVYDRAADMYDRLGVEFFGTAGEWLVDAAALQPGDQVLDIGCGRGATTFPAAIAVGAAGRVLAVDLAPRMLELLRADAAARHISNIVTRLADAQDLEIAGRAFDCVLAAFVLFFMTDPARALRRYRELLRPSGRIAITTFAADDERWRWTRELAEMVPAAARLPNLTASPAFSTDDALHMLLTESGFAAARSTVRERVLCFRDADHWLQWSMSHGQRSVWERIPPGRIADAERFARTMIDDIAVQNGAIELRRFVRITTATRPVD